MGPLILGDEVTVNW